MSSENDSDMELSDFEELPMNAEDFKEEGNDKYKAKDYKGAIASYSKAIELAPTNSTFLTNRAAAYLMTQNYREVSIFNILIL